MQCEQAQTLIGNAQFASTWTSDLYLAKQLSQPSMKLQVQVHETGGAPDHAVTASCQKLDTATSAPMLTPSSTYRVGC